jgi:hypothetical protein
MASKDRSMMGSRESGSTEGADDESVTSYGTSEASEGEQRSWFERMILEGGLVEGKLFQVFIGVAILVNCVMIGVETDMACRGQSCKPEDDTIWLLTENLFLVIFLLEAILKIRAYGFWGYWEDSWNR